MAAPQRSDSSANLLLNLVDGHRVTAVIYVAARLGIADLLLEGSKSAPELARLTDSHEGSLLRLMRALVTLRSVRKHRTVPSPTAPPVHALRENRAIPAT
jgi:Dimerisation domain